MKRRSFFRILGAAAMAAIAPQAVVEAGGVLVPEFEGIAHPIFAGEVGRYNSVRLFEIDDPLALRAWQKRWAVEADRQARREEQMLNRWLERRANERELQFGDWGEA